MVKTERRCWHTTIGKKHRVLCNDDKTEKRRFVLNDVHNYLQGCNAIEVNGKPTQAHRSDDINYGVQSGKITDVQCKRRHTGARCWNTKIDKVELPICENDPPAKKVDILDVVDTTLVRCTTARLYYEPKKKGVKRTKQDSFTMRRVGGLNSSDRRMAGLFVIRGDAKEIQCAQRTKKM